VRAIEATIRALHELGCAKINLQVTPHNSVVVDFYCKLGYEVEERISMGKLLAVEGTA
jgi:ribosomal protein S18 acetylase RimI-like enzyme